LKIRTKSGSPLLKRAKRGFRGYPAATVVFYGPTAEEATKVAVGIVRREGAEPELLERWFSETTDVRSDARIGEEILTFIQTHEVKTVLMTDGLLGCPHEEGIDYPEGEPCPQCPYWAERDRFTGKIKG
jgi:hypothetical protein